MIEQIIVFIKKGILFLYFIFFVFKNTNNKIELLTSFAKQDKLRIGLKNGIIIYTSKNNTRTALVCREIFWQNVYTPSFMPIKHDDIVIDIGSDIGVFSIFASTKTNNKIFAYEPLKESYDLLQKNCQVNGIKNIIYDNLAVSDSTNRIKFYINTIPQMSSVSS